jgi:hypothetical protein
VGAGIHKDVETAAETMVSVGESYLPNKAFRKRYDILYSIQTEAYTALDKAKIFDKLAELD